MSEVLTDDIDDRDAKYDAHLQNWCAGPPREGRRYSPCVFCVSEDEDYQRMWGRSMTENAEIREEIEREAGIYPTQPHGDLGPRP